MVTSLVGVGSYGQESTFILSLPCILAKTSVAWSSGLVSEATPLAAASVYGFFQYYSHRTKARDKSSIAGES